MASANDSVDEKIEIATESDSESSDKAHESPVSGFETTPKKKSKHYCIFRPEWLTEGPSKSYSHRHVGEGWKQTDTSFPIALYVGSVSLANGRGRSQIKRDLCGPQNPAHGGTKISGDHPRGL